MSSRKNPICLRPRFLPRGYRFLRPEEFVVESDWYWSHTHKCYLKVNPKRAKEIAGTTIPFIRRK